MKIGTFCACATWSAHAPIFLHTGNSLCACATFVCACAVMFRSLFWLCTCKTWEVQFNIREMWSIENKHFLRMREFECACAIVCVCFCTFLCACASFYVYSLLLVFMRVCLCSVHVLCIDPSKPSIKWLCDLHPWFDDLETFHEFSLWNTWQLPHIYVYTKSV